MFGQYFGNYLVKKNKISQSQFEDIMRQQQNTRLKLGLIAVAEKLLTIKQADEVNELQKNMDLRFGDIAIEKGFLLNEEVTYLLNMQGNPYLTFIQTLIEHTDLSMNDIEEYLMTFQSDYHLSNSDIDALKSGDIDRIMPVFVDVNDCICGECISLTIRNIVRFINHDIMLKKAYKVQEYSFTDLATQQMIGDHQIFLGFAGKDHALLKIAEPFAKETFSEMNEDAFDSVCEFINCSNGLYASKLSQEDIHIDMTPPRFYTNKTLITDGDIYVIPVVIQGLQADLLVSIDTQVKVN